MLLISNYKCLENSGRARVCFAISNFQTKSLVPLPLTRPLHVLDLNRGQTAHPHRFLIYFSDHTLKLPNCFSFTLTTGMAVCQSIRGSNQTKCDQIHLLHKHYHSTNVVWWAPKVFIFKLGGKQDFRQIINILGRTLLYMLEAISSLLGVWGT